MAATIWGARRSLASAILLVAVLFGHPAAATAASGPDRLDAIARANGKTRVELEAILQDRYVRVGKGDRLYYADPALADPEPAAAPSPAPYPYSQTFQLHSRAGSPRVIYLDFDGETITNTAWNNDPGFGTGSSFYAEAFNRDGTAGFSDAEMDQIQEIWQRVAEDYAPFDVDVTTEDPGAAAIARSSSSDLQFGTRALITHTTSVYGACGCGGVAYVNVFSAVGATHDYYQPAFVFDRGLGTAKVVADSVSHEVGHNLALLHHGTQSLDYYQGHGVWGPIMGAPFPVPLTQWSKGEYTGASRPTQDDVAVISRSGAPLLADDHADTIAGATLASRGTTVAATGMITTAADVDVFRVTAAPGQATFSVAPAPAGPNLDLLLELRTGSGALLARDDPPAAKVSSAVASGLGASITTNLVSGGDLYLFVSGVGSGVPFDPSTGYSDYGSLGRYTLSGTLPTGAATATALGSSANPSVAGQSVTFTATVSVPPPGSGTPNGTVGFTDGSAAIPGCAARPLASGQATCTVALAGGTHSVRAAYSGSPAFSASTSSPLAQVVNPAASTVTLGSGLNPSVSGQTVTFGASVATVGGLGAPTGTVTFKDGGATACASVPLAAGSASCSVSRLAGNHPMTAEYSGDASYAASTSGTFTQVVNKAASTVVLTSSANPAVQGQPLAITATVAVVAPGTGTPAGTVTFTEGATILCPAVPVAAGAATCSPSLAAGAHSLTATYNGSTQLDPSTTPVALSQTVLPPGSTFSAVTPTRLLDTRIGTGGPAAPIGPGAANVRELVVRGAGTPVPADATAVVLNVTATQGTANGDYLTVYPSGVPQPLASNLNVNAGQTIPNAVVVGVGTGGRISIFNALGTVHVLADVVGYYGTGGATFVPVTPLRLLDTRFGTGGPAVPVGAGAANVRDLVVRGGSTGVPVGATGVVLNMTVTQPTAGSYLTVWPSGIPQPLASNLNFSPGQTIPNLVTVGIGGNGRVSIYNDAGTSQVIADIVGYYVPTGGSTFVPVTPRRLLDTRNGTGGPATAFGGGETRDLLVRGGSTGIPTTATAVVLNVTAILPDANGGYLTVYPSGVAQPLASNLNFGIGDIIPNLVVVGVGPSGRVSLANAVGNVHVAADVVGFMT